MERDKNLQRILLKKEMTEPPVNLDELIMAKVFKLIKQNSGNRKYLYLSWIFFVFGLVTGIMISTTLVGDDNNILGINFSEYKLIIQILCAFVILTLFERIYSSTIDLRNKHYDIEME
jgi:hypothetical protein